MVRRPGNIVTSPDPTKSVWSTSLVVLSQQTCLDFWMVTQSTISLASMYDLALLHWLVQNADSAQPRKHSMVTRSFSSWEGGVWAWDYENEACNFPFIIGTHVTICCTVIGLSVYSATQEIIVMNASCKTGCGHVERAGVRSKSLALVLNNLLQVAQVAI